MSSISFSFLVTDHIDKPLSEAALLGICLSHKDGTATRDKALYLKRSRKHGNRKNMTDFFGEVPPPILAVHDWVSVKQRTPSSAMARLWARTILSHQPLGKRLIERPSSASCLVSEPTCPLRRRWAYRDQPNPAPTRASFLFPAASRDCTTFSATDPLPSSSRITWRIIFRRQRKRSWKRLSGRV